MREESALGEAVRLSMGRLGSGDGMVRERARDSLVAIGGPSVHSLGKALRGPSPDQLRWEAAKALGKIGDRRSIPALVGALRDRDSDVAWLAAEGLALYGIAAWPAVLLALVKAGPDSARLRRGAGQVFARQGGEGFDDLLRALRKDLKSGGIKESAIVKAYALLDRITRFPRRPPGDRKAPND
jgi:hypothetical protein